MYQQPGPTPNYRQDDPTFAPDHSQAYNGGDVKTQEVRFKPKSRINDPVFLIIFVLQVRLYRFITLSCKARVFLVSSIHRLVWHSLNYMDITRRFRGRPWCGWRSIGHSSDIEQVFEVLFPLSCSNIFVNRSTVYLLLLITAVAVFLSVVYLILTRLFTKIIMHITLVLTILLNMYTLFFVSVPRELTIIIILQWYMRILLDN